MWPSWPLMLSIPALDVVRMYNPNNHLNVDLTRPVVEAIALRSFMPEDRRLITGRVKPLTYKVDTCHFLP